MATSPLNPHQRRDIFVCATSLHTVQSAAHILQANVHMLTWESRFGSGEYYGTGYGLL